MRDLLPLAVATLLFACAEEAPVPSPVATPATPAATPAMPSAEAAAEDGDVIAAASHFRAGVDLATRGRDTEAIAAYRRALAESPTYTEAWYNLGNSLARQLDVPGAMAAYEEVLALDSTHISARHNLAAMHVKQLNYAQAITEHEQVLRLDPRHVSTYYDLAYIHFIRGEFDRVEELLRGGRQLAPEEARFPRLLGRMRHKQLRYDEAVASLEEAVTLDSTEAVSFADLAQARLKAGDAAGAAEAARRSIALDPHAKDPLFVLANALRKLGRNDEATAVLTEFRALDEVDSEIRKNLRILGNDPDDHEARAMLGLLYSGQGRHAEAAEALRHAVSVAPDSARYFNNLGNAYVGSGDIGAAIAAYGQALEADAAYPKAAFNLGVALLRAQRFEAAEEALETALAGAGEESVDIQYQLGLLRARRGDFAAAAAAFEPVVEARPADTEVRRKLAISYLKAGRVDDSKEQLRRVAEIEDAR